MSSPLTPQGAFANLQATAFTARCHNGFFRQKQLKALHDSLRKHSSAVKDAIEQDTHVSDEDAATEVALALNIVQEHYWAIDVQKDLKREYFIADGKNAVDKRAPWGVIYIKPQQNHTPFFAVITPLSAALAAGNCVALALESSHGILPSLLCQLLPEALESDTFAIIPSNPDEQDSNSCHFQVLQESQRMAATYPSLVSPGSKVVAIVDRTADLALAAEQLVTARFAFGGSSPYAPDIVLVNEFAKKEFVEHVLKYSIRFLAGPGGVPNGSLKVRAQKKTSSTASTLEALQDSNSWNLHMITRGDNGAIVELSDLSTLPPKLDQPVLAFSTTTSLEHAISLIDEDLDPQQTLLAAYHFGTPPTAKYLSQFVPADASFANHIPVRLLLGPAAPSCHPLDIEKRYTTVHFTRASPAYITLPPASPPGLLTTAHAAKDSCRAAAALLTHATQEIKEGKRAEHVAFGYFEKSIFIGLSVVGIPLIAGVGISLFYGLRRRGGFVVG